MESFLIRLLITIGLIWLTQVLLEALSINQPARKIIYVAVILVLVLFLIMGGFPFYRV